METAELIAAMNDLALDENSDWAEALCKEIDDAQCRFDDQSKRMAMSASDLELTYSL